MILSLLLTLIFFLLGGLHLSWVIGGTLGFAQSLPTNEQGHRVLNPGKLETATVSLALITFGVLYLLKSGLIPIDTPQLMLKSGGWIVPSIFLVRAIGEFKYVGFFKKVRNTEFGRLDTRCFSPLCLGIATIGYLIQWYDHVGEPSVS